MPAASPNPFVNLGTKNTNIYVNETLTSFFRRLTFAPDGSLLFTPAGQYKTTKPGIETDSKPVDETTNTVYIYSRAGLNKPPVAHLPGHKKPSIAVRCSPVVYNHRLTQQTQNIALDTSSKEDDITPLPEPAHPTHLPRSTPTPDRAQNIPDATSISLNPPQASPTSDAAVPPVGPKPAFALPYRIIYAVATQDTVYVYDTQQTTPLCVVSNLHYATFTDLAWSNDGNTLLISSSDGFASTLTFADGELGTRYHGALQTRVSQPSHLNTTALSSLAPSPNPTPTGVPSARSPGPALPTLPRQPSIATAFGASPSPAISARPVSPTRSNSASSIATQSSFPQTPASYPGLSNPIPTIGKLPGVAAAGSSVPTIASPTPPMTPLPGSESVNEKATSSGFAVPSFTSKRASESEGEGRKRPGEGESEGKEGKVKKRRIAPTLMGASEQDSGGVAG